MGARIMAVTSAADTTHRLFTLNIGGPSLDRAARLAEYLLQQDLDVIVLTETRPNLGTASLIDALCGSGYEAFWPRPPIAGERGVALLTRTPDRSCLRRDGSELGHRLVVESVTLEFPVTLVGAYVPSRDASPQKIARKQGFIKQFVGVLSDPGHFERTIVMGDLNVVGRDHCPKYPAFRAWEYEVLEQIDELGFVDVYASLHPGVQAHSWIGRMGAGYRYDYVFASRDLADTALDCEYVHEVRNARLSDHAGVLLTLAAASGRGAGAERPRLATG